ncbi:MAG TPA: VWA domain-containing protein [Dokdonella sp.]|uniref:VWA domain-containing protein n=1 Tax=Dokdonella sp. TaxID=2291710 RepID=UPI0025C1957E|nr:VWA domain-containing protein [Dokdonella sp.]MBX3690723.1 VWA domain-containing protein [Dokdonella sp.]MCW5566866.1 VWA domain-containing protein [Dokdonella sp.]HNR91192.1 VWA domain-containing protein [Dokdonella sp.]
MNALADFHFLRPWWLLALLALPLAWVFVRRARGQAGAWRHVVDAHLLPYLLEAAPMQARSTAPWLATVLWPLACIALAGPAWERENLPLYRNDAARVIALELAPTMLAADVKPTRLARARYKINDILDASRDLQTALIGYAGDAFVAAPLTDDIETVRNLVAALDPGVMPVTGNATGRAITQAQRLIEQAGLSRGEIIVIADASGRGGIEAARAAHARGFSVSVLGIGSIAGAPVPLSQGGFLQDSAGNIVLPKLDEAGLRALADAGGGRYATLAADRGDLAVLLGDLRGSASSGGESEAASARFRDRGPWFALALLPLALLAFRRGWLVVLALVVLPLPHAEAFEFADLWLRRDQQAAAALAEGDNARARELASDPALRGSAAYREGDHAAAEEAFAAAQGADADYNRGNALARLGRYEEALAAYERALSAAPDMDDAKANHAAVKEWLERQQKDQDSQQSGDRQQDGQQQDGQRQDDQQQGGGQQDDQQQGEQAQGGESQDGQEQDGQQQDSQQKGDQQKDGQQNEGDPREGQDKNDTQGDAKVDAEKPAEQREQDRQALSQAIDQALGEESHDQGETPLAVSREEEAAREQKQAIEQWLQRVPDDPGGLLRRKFQLEYERRQRGGGG